LEKPEPFCQPDAKEGARYVQTQGAEGMMWGGVRKKRDFGRD